MSPHAFQDLIRRLREQTGVGEPEIDGMVATWRKKKTWVSVVVDCKGVYWAVPDIMGEGSWRHYCKCHYFSTNRQFPKRLLDRLRELAKEER